MPEPYQVRVTGPALRCIDRLPRRVAAAVVEFVTGRLVDSPARIGKPLRGRFAGLYAARVGEYRVRYRIDDDVRVVVVLHVAHHADAYRPD